MHYYVKYCRWQRINDCIRLKTKSCDRRAIATDSKPNPVLKNENFIEMDIKLCTSNTNAYENWKTIFF
jgi:hypothetical protein